MKLAETVKAVHAENTAIFRPGRVKVPPVDLPPTVSHSLALHFASSAKTTFACLHKMSIKKLLFSNLMEKIFLMRLMPPLQDKNKQILKLWYNTSPSPLKLSESRKIKKAKNNGMLCHSLGGKVIFFVAALYEHNLL